MNLLSYPAEQSILTWKCLGGNLCAVCLVTGTKQKHSRNCKSDQGLTGRHLCTWLLWRCAQVPCEEPHQLLTHCSRIRWEHVWNCKLQWQSCWYALCLLLCTALGLNTQSTIEQLLNCDVPKANCRFPTSSDRNNTHLQQGKANTNSIQMWKNKSHFGAEILRQVCLVRKQVSEITFH